MVKDSLVTKTQAQALKELGFNEPVAHYSTKSWEQKGITNIAIRPNNNNRIPDCTSVPTADEVIDWLRRKYDIIIYDRIEPFVDPEDKTHKTILFEYSVKRCDTNHLGWNGRIYLGTTRLTNDVYSLKLEAIDIALEYIKSQKKCGKQDRL